MTLSQLRAFALVARLGSLHAAAAALGVSEPAVSSALAALRHDLGDPLFVRVAGGIALTPGGRALADHAQEIVGLADKARWEVEHAQTAAGMLRIVATAAFAEHAAGRLLDAFTKRVPGATVDVVVEAAADIGSMLLDRAY
ncbi:MAG: LysR family transcriptional regulator, partial [Chloroflexota bacterium]|nr:LysR family transcriptional regulator [Chloroflexota bacterium]